MYKTRDERVKKLTELVNKFENNFEEYKNKNYKEAKLRTDFLNPFFEILDWDVRNEAGKSEDYRDVLIEDSLEVGNSKQAPDFCFKIGRERKFYVEAKKPSVDIKNEIEPSLQVRRYGYTAGLPLSILTDFEELSVYDTSIKPNKNDKASTARIRFLSFREYPDNFDYLYDTFSKTAIEKGSFDKFAAGTKNKRGTESIDKGLLSMVEEFRLTLAKNISKLNEIDKDSLNSAVIKIIDRVIFLRIAEDKKVEPYGALLNASKNESVYNNLKKIFKAADFRYNSELFKNNHLIDTLEIDDKILKSIIESLYYPECSYEFSVLPVSILGNIYEQFLGQTIRQTESGMVKIEEKPEVRKAGGVYYTPQYIVDYIVKNTVGEKIKGLAPKEIEKITVLDPACGSGSFLIGAYQYLLDYHLEYYTKPDNIKNALKNHIIAKMDEYNYRLTISEKQKILKNNIYGVDIDAQAVEVSKFSLMLKLMETESGKTMQQQELLPISHMEGKKGMKILPDLSNNIKCGNSLVGKDFIADNLFADNEEIKRINPFDWEEGFPEIMRSGGFDCVIGNPPYIDSEEMTKSQLLVRDYIVQRYKYAKGNWDIYIAFFEKGVSLLNDKGLLGYITPDKWISKPFGYEMRKGLLQFISNMLFVGSKVFDTVRIDAIITIVNAKSSKTIDVYKFDNVQLKINKKSINKNIIKEPYRFDIVLSDNVSIILALEEKFDSCNKYVVCENACATSDTYILKDLIINASDNVDTRKYFRVINTGTIDKYISKWGKKEMTYLKDKYLYPVVPKDKFLSTFINSYSKKTVKSKIIMKGLTLLENCIDLEGNIIPGKATLVIVNDDYNKLKIISAILNSKLPFFYIKNKYSASSYCGGISFTKDMINSLPLPDIDVNNAKKLITLVDIRVELQKSVHDSSTEKDKEMYQQKADIIDKQIDKLVYELYGLTNEEIKIVEGAEGTVKKIV